jgi:hypothetical protein
MFLVDGDYGHYKEFREKATVEDYILLIKDKISKIKK